MITSRPKSLALTIFGILAAVHSPAHAEADGDIIYEVKSGDTLYDLDRDYLIGSNTAAIARLNRVANPRRLQIGKKLRLPRRLLIYRPLTLSVRGFSGPVEIDGNAPEVGKRIEEGALISTGRNGFVSFQSSAGTSVSLPSNSKVKLDRARIYKLGDLRDVEFKLLNGRGEIVVPRLNAQERFLTGTPLAVTAVRGTEFRVAFGEDSDNSITEVVEGSVSVENDSNQVVASEGFAVAASSSGLTDPQELPNAPEIVEPGRVQTDEDIVFALRAPTEAIATRTQVSRDAGFLEVVSESIDTEQEASFQNIGDGRYFVRSRAITQSGVEGYAEAYTFRRKRLGVTATVEQSELADAFKFAWTTQGEGPVTHAFQLWREDERDALIVDEIALGGNAILLTGLEPGTYLWRVAAMQADEGDWLAVWGEEQRLTVSE